MTRKRINFGPYRGGMIELIDGKWFFNGKLANHRMACRLWKDRPTMWQMETVLCTYSEFQMINPILHLVP